MHYCYFEDPAMLEILRGSERSLFIFSASKEEYQTLHEFGYACGLEEYKWKKNRSQELGGTFTIPWEIYQKQFSPCSVLPPIFIEKQDFCVCGLETKPALVVEENILSAMAFDDEWNSVFIIAELAESYLGYWWETSA